MPSTKTKKTYYVAPLEEHPTIKCKEVRARNERGATILFSKIFGIKGQILRPINLEFEMDRNKKKNE